MFRQQYEDTTFDNEDFNAAVSQLIFLEEQAKKLGKFNEAAEINQTLADLYTLNLKKYKYYMRQAAINYKNFLTINYPLELSNIAKWRELANFYHLAGEFHLAAMHQQKIAEISQETLDYRKTAENHQLAGNFSSAGFCHEQAAKISKNLLDFENAEKDWKNSAENYQLARNFISASICQYQAASISKKPADWRNAAEYYYLANNLYSVADCYSKAAEKSLDASDCRIAAKFYALVDDNHSAAVCHEQAAQLSERILDLKNSAEDRRNAAKYFYYNSEFKTAAFCQEYAAKLSNNILDWHSAKEMYRLAKYIKSAKYCEKAIAKLKYLSCLVDEAKKYEEKEDFDSATKRYDLVKWQLNNSHFFKLPKQPINKEKSHTIKTSFQSS